MDANNFWEVMETNEVSKDEIVLLTSYLIDLFRKQGFNLVADKFLKEAKIEEVKELQGSFLDYNEPWMKPGGGMNAWIFFCQDRLKLKGLKEDTSQTTTNQQRLKVDPDKDTISGPKKEALMKLLRYIFKYFNRRSSD